ncbi:MAG: PDZ domain-containing protein, partial [Planctomycetia bacterium]|nr:PDZ domain-containing protein [Planctomycetia bacterium]
TAQIVSDDPSYQYYVTPESATTYPTRIVGRDPRSGLAVLQVVDATGAPIPLTDSGCTEISFTDSPDPPTPGTFVLLMSNPLCAARDGTLSASWGIVANTRRPDAPQPSADIPSGRRTLAQYGTLLSTDIPMITGREGGPLADLPGRCIGTVVAMETLPGVTSSESYAIPVDPIFRRALRQLREGYEVGYGFLGVEMKDSRDGVRIQRILRGVPAESAGLRTGDYIISIEETPVTGAQDVVRRTSWYEPDAVVPITVRRENEPEPVLIHVPLIRLPVPGQIVTRRPEAWRGMEIAASTIVDPGIARGMGRYHSGAVITRVDEFSPSQEAGLQRGMIITAIGDQPVMNPGDFYRITETLSPESDVTLRITAADSQSVLRTVTGKK